VFLPLIAAPNTRPQSTGNEADPWNPVSMKNNDNAIVETTMAHNAATPAATVRIKRLIRAG
jgi:hypothetical protein